LAGAGSDVLIVTAPDPLAHVPDPDDRFQVFGYLNRDGEPVIEIANAETRDGLTIPLLEALKVSGDIGRQASYLLEYAIQKALFDDERDAAAPPPTIPGLSAADMADAWLRGLRREPG
jgi:hypothetical protein